METCPPPGLRVLLWKGAGKLKGSADLRWRLVRVIVNELNIGDEMAPAVEVGSKPGGEQVLRARSAPPAAPSGIVGYHKDVNIHDNHRGECGGA